MIKSVGQGPSVAIEAAKLRESARAVAPAKVRTDLSSNAAENVKSPAARMAAEGTPVDMANIERVKAAIASGNYPVDPQRIAEKMVELDLPQTRH